MSVQLGFPVSRAAPEALQMNAVPAQFSRERSELVSHGDLEPKFLCDFALKGSSRRFTRLDLASRKLPFEPGWPALEAFRCKNMPVPQNYRGDYMKINQRETD